MKPSCFFYVRALGLTWVLCVLLGFAFPGPERALQGLQLLASAFWARFLVAPALEHGQIGVLPAMEILAIASTLTVMLVAIGLDAVRARITFWLRSVIGFVACGLGAILSKLLYEVTQGQALGSAVERMELGGDFLAYVVFCISSGLLLGSAFTLIYCASKRVLQAAKNGGAANRGGPVASSTHPGSPAVRSG